MLQTVTLLRDRIGDPTAYPFCVPAIAALKTLHFRTRSGLFLLDEPEEALSPQRQLSFLILILADIHGYLRSGPSVIRLLVFDAIRSGSEQICDFPEAGWLEAKVTATSLKTVRSILVHPYRILYRPDTSPITIFAVLHGAREVLSIPRGSPQT